MKNRRVCWRFVVKIAGGSVPANAAQGLPLNTGLMLVLSQATLRVDTVLADEGARRAAGGAELGSRVVTDSAAVPRKAESSILRKA